VYVVIQSNCFQVATAFGIIPLNKKYYVNKYNVEQIYSTKNSCYCFNNK
jgi:hypothetical protein